MPKKKSAIKHGKMYKVSGGGAIRGFRVNPAGTVEVLVVPGHASRRAGPKKKKAKKRSNPFGKKLWRPKKIRSGLYKGQYLISKGPSHTFGRRRTKAEAQKEADRLNYS
jgi:hypothetical protein